VGRDVAAPYDIPEEVRKASSERLTALNAKRKDEGRYGHSEATKAKLRTSTAAAIAEGRIKRVSQLEVAVGKVLDSLGIPYDHQHAIRDSSGRFIGVLDYYLTDHCAALEVNGTYWHADPRKYPDGPAHASQARTASRYQRKREELLQRGIPLVEVWEQDFKSDPEGAVKDALSLLV